MGARAAVPLPWAVVPMALAVVSCSRAAVPLQLVAVLLSSAVVLLKRAVVPLSLAAMGDSMYTRSRQLGFEQTRYLFESALIEVSQAVGRLLPEVKGGQMESTKDGELSWMVVCTLRGSHVANLEEIEVQIFDHTWEEGLVRVMQAALARLVFHHRVELEAMRLPRAQLGRRDEEGFPTEGLKTELKLAKLKSRRQQKHKLRVREANYMLKVKVMHLKTALREAEDKLETLQDEGEDLCKEDTTLISDDDDYMEDEGDNWNGQDNVEDEEDLAFINDEPENPEPLHSEEVVADDDEEEDHEEPPFEDNTILVVGNRDNDDEGGNDEEAPRSRLRDFQNTNPHVFSKCTAPLDADDWLRTIENNLEVVVVGEHEKVLLATHFLSGPARVWWENVKPMQVADHVINWEEFTAKFRKDHIPTGLIKMKRDEFFNLKQNNCNVVEYLDKFKTLARYAPQDTDTDEKRRDRFLNGLHEEIQSILVAVSYPDLEALVDAAIMVESKRKAADETRKRKMQQQQSGPSHAKFRSPPT
ncbi:hypothetical protein QYE76_010400 [Lolium multiflorum]|uniref:Retrotransposon gag domain-containing protein n=1 Tax=Lolium multiflorum TaxID=4521 RepID=A0AAD8TX48_LOLMU|nr:hypothetical protein QYE76_010400 [Lolium multiflorum]